MAETHQADCVEKANGVLGCTDSWI